MSERRRKRTGPEVREEALAVARALLLETGPHAVTLANVGDALGMTHANVLYHFGSAADLQSALMGSMVTDLTVALDHVVEAIRTDESAPLMVIDRVFDAFGKGGAGSLAAWIVLSGNVEHLEPVRDAVRSLVDALIAQTGDVEAAGRVREIVLLMSVAAFGDAVIGSYLREMLGEKNDAMRALTARILPYLIIPSGVSPATPLSGG